MIQVDLAGPTTLETQRSQFLRGFPDNTRFQGVSRATVGSDVPGYRIGADWSSKDTPIQGDFLLAVKGARVFSLEAVALKSVFDTYRAKFGQLIDSFEITLDPTIEPIDTTAQPEDILDVIGNRVARIRGLSAPPELERRFQTREDFTAGSEVLDEERRRETRRLQDLCVVLDLCSQTDDLLQIQLGLLDIGVLGYYKSEEKSLTVVTGQQGPNFLSWLTYAHEYTHALQDNEFGLSTILAAEEDTFDSARAASALIEGDAKLSEHLFYDSLPSEQQTLLAQLLEGEIEKFSRSPAVARLPRIIRETFGWEQTAGSKFVMRLYLKGGFGAIDEAYGNPPRTSEQVLHPEKYLAGEERHPVQLPDLASALGSAWQMRDEGVLGEFLTRIYLDTFLTAAKAVAAAEGWGGDRYSLLNDDQGRSLIAIRYSWDTVEDADEFFQAYLDFVHEKSQGQWELVEMAEDMRLWVGINSSSYLALEGVTALLVIGPDRATVEAVANKIPGFAAEG